jgi:hypothetical protein
MLIALTSSLLLPAMCPSGTDPPCGCHAAALWHFRVAIAVWQFSLNQSEIAVTANPKHQISTTAAPYGFY